MFFIIKIISGQLKFELQVTNILSQDNHFVHHVICKVEVIMSIDKIIDLIAFHVLLNCFLGQNH